MWKPFITTNQLNRWASRTILFYRYYNEQKPNILSFIQKTKDTGLQPNKIQKFLQFEPNDLEQVHQVIEQCLVRIDRRVAELQVLKVPLSS